MSDGQLIFLCVIFLRFFRRNKCGLEFHLSSKYFNKINSIQFNKITKSQSLDMQSFNIQNKKVLAWWFLEEEKNKITKKIPSFVMKLICG